MKELVSKITVCYQFGYHKAPFVHGVRDGKDVWLRDDGSWTEDEADPRIAVAINVSFYPGGTWHGFLRRESQAGDKEC